MGHAWVTEDDENYIISQSKHMLWVLKRTFSRRRFAYAIWLVGYKLYYSTRLELEISFLTLFRPMAFFHKATYINGVRRSHVILFKNIVFLSLNIVFFLSKQDMSSAWVFASSFTQGWSIPFHSFRHECSVTEWVTPGLPRMGCSLFTKVLVNP